jgi:hypothetical protein
MTTFSIICALLSGVVISVHIARLRSRGKPVSMNLRMMQLFSAALLALLMFQHYR